MVVPSYQNIGQQSGIERRSHLQVVQETLRERGVRVEVDQVWSLLRLEEPDSLPVLLDGHSHLGEHGLSLLPNVLRPLKLGLPGLGEL